MFTNLIDSLRQAGLPISITEYLALIEAVDAGISQYSVEDFYYLSRATLVKDERHLDRFDRIFGEVFKGLESSADLDGIVLDVPDEWLKTLSQLMLSEEEKAKIDALGGWEKLMDTLRERLNEQKKKHTVITAIVMLNIISIIITCFFTPRAHRRIGIEYGPSPWKNEVS